MFHLSMVSFFKGGYREMNSVYIQVCLVTALMVTSNGVYLVIACFVMETARYCKLCQA